MLERWWEERYSLPCTHDLFRKQPLAVWLKAFYEDRWERKEEIEERLKSEQLPGQERARLMGVLKALSDLFQDQATDTRDPLVAYWEEQEARGEEPNLDLTLADLRLMGRI